MPGLLWMINRQPIGPTIVSSKLRGGLKCSQEDMSGERVDWLRRFKASWVCERSWSQIKLGNKLETQERMERRLVLKVQMARSDMLWRWTSGGTSWKVQFHS